MNFKLWQHTCTTALTAAVLTLGGTMAMAEDSPLAGPEAGAPTTQPSKGMDGKGHGPRGDRPEPLQQLLKGIELTAEQKTKIEAIRQSAMAEMKKFHEAHKAEIEKLRDETKAAMEAKDREKMQQLREQREKLFADAPRPLQAAQDIRAVLTEEQAKQFDANLAEAKKRMEEHRAGKGPRPEGKDGKGPRPEGKHKGPKPGADQENSGQIDM